MTDHDGARRSRRAFAWLRSAPLLELGLIVVGALLALALEDWQEARERTERDRVMLTMVSAELSANAERLSEDSRYHNAMLAPIMQSVRRMRQEGLFGLPEGWQGVRPIILTSAAYELALQNGTLARVPAKAALQLAEAYEQLDALERSRANVQLVTLQTDFQDGPRYLRLQAEGVRVERDGAASLAPVLENAVTVLDDAIDAL